MSRSTLLKQLLNSSKGLTLATLVGIGFCANAVPVHPFWDQGTASGLNLENLNTAGVKPIVAFATASAGCMPKLAGGVSESLDPSQFYALSFGGNSGQYVTLCVVGGDTAKIDPSTGAGKTQAEADAEKVAVLMYEFFTSQVQKEGGTQGEMIPLFSSTPSTLDFDIEQGHSDTTFSNFVRFQALQLLMTGFTGTDPITGKTVTVPAIPNLQVTFTLPTLPTGLNVPNNDGNHHGVNFLLDLNKYIATYGASSVKWFAGINSMAMDYGSKVHNALPANQDNSNVDFNGDMGDAAYTSVTGVYDQIQNFTKGTNYVKPLFKSFGGDATISVTPMIGQNDTQNLQFYLKDATELQQKFGALPYAGFIGYWSLTRDQVCLPLPFNLGGTNPKGYCSNVNQAVSFGVADKSGVVTTGGFFNAFSGKTDYSSNPGQALGSTPKLAATQIKTADDKWTPYYSLSVTFPSNSDAQYIAVSAKPVSHDKSYDDVLKTIPGCSYLADSSQSEPAATFSDVFLASGTVDTKTDPAFFLCPFTTYNVEYFTMPVDGEWSTQGFSFGQVDTGVPQNAISQGLYSGQVGLYNTSTSTPSGAFLVVNAIPDWGQIEGSVILGGTKHAMVPGHYLYFDPKPIANEPYIIQAAYPPSYNTITLKSKNYISLPVGKYAVLMSVLDKLDSFKANVGFVGAPEKVTPKDAQLSSAQSIGNYVDFQWGHISTALGLANSQKTFDLNVYKGDTATGSPIYTKTDIPDDVTVDANTLQVPVQNAGDDGEGIPRGSEYTYEIIANAPGADWYYSDATKGIQADRFTGNVYVPSQLTPSPLQVKVNLPKGGSYSNANFPYDVSLTNISNKPVPIAPGTTVVFNTPFNNRIYGGDQTDCGDPMDGNKTYGLKFNNSGFGVGQVTIPVTESTSTLVQNGQEAYCLNTLTIGSAIGNNMLMPHEVWHISLRTNADGLTETKPDTDGEATMKMLQSTLNAFESPEVGKVGCFITLNVPLYPNEKDIISSFPSPDDVKKNITAGSITVNLPSSASSENNAQWKLEWQPTGDKYDCNMTTFLSPAGSSSPFPTGGTSGDTGYVTISRSAFDYTLWSETVHSFQAGQQPEMCQDNWFIDSLSGKADTGHIQPFKAQVTNGTQTYQCQVTVSTYNTSPPPKPPKE